MFEKLTDFVLLNIAVAHSLLLFYSILLYEFITIQIPQRCGSSACHQVSHPTSRGATWLMGQGDDKCHPYVQVQEQGLYIIPVTFLLLVLSWKSCLVEQQEACSLNGYKEVDPSGTGN